MEHDVLLYFVKYPEPGKVKTRLARTIGNEEAARRYRRLAEDNLDVLRPMARNGTLLTVVFTPYEAERVVKEWLSPEFSYLPQNGDGLGERIANAFRQSFTQGAKQVIALGSDTLGLKVDLIRTAFRELKRCDVVLGPAKDGGYYLIGLSKFEESLFTNISWSTSNVLESTVARIREKKLSCWFLKGLEDLDEVEPIA